MRAVFKMWLSLHQLAKSSRWIAPKLVVIVAEELPIGTFLHHKHNSDIIVLLHSTMEGG
jgi:hypothetical protein